MENTPKANRLHIGFFGKCNAGKSTVINMITGQEISLVSEVAGTTTDPVMKAMEILPLGPVMLVDTAGIDDNSALGQLRIRRTKELLPQMNLALYVLRTDVPVEPIDIEWLQLLAKEKINVLLVINEVNRDKSIEKAKDGLLTQDTMTADHYIARYQEELSQFSFSYLGCNASLGTNRKALLDKIGAMQGKDEESKTLLEGVIDPGDLIILVCPIDTSAPKGRLILPQVQMIREILDKKGLALVVQTHELAEAIERLKEPPKLVITDSQAFEAVAAIVPPEIPLTSFSILMARFKGDLKALVAGARALKELKEGSKVLISEGCTHHRQCDDIGTVKIPQWLHKAGYTNLDLTWTAGGKFPVNVGDYELIIHCGGCMLTRREVLRRIEAATYEGVPIVNYGVLIAFLHGILDRALGPFMDQV